MSTITSVAAPILLYGPAPARHPYNLFTVASRITADRWEAGFSFGGYPTGVPSGFDPCTEGTFRTKDDTGSEPYGTFLPFYAYKSVVCSALGVGNWDAFRRRLVDVLDATLPYAAEKQLSQGSYLGTSATDPPYLGDTNLDILAGGAAQTPGVALAYLEEAIAGATVGGKIEARAGVIHATPGAASAWSFDGGLTVVGGQLQTWLGTPVVVGAGYVGADPASGATPGAGQGWAFATGPVVYGEGELLELSDQMSETLDRSNNDVVFRAERELVVGWDTSLQAGVLVDWTP